MRPASGLAGWLDKTQGDAKLTPAETAFVELALAAWRATNSAGRKALRKAMKQAVRDSLDGSAELVGGA